MQCPVGDRPAHAAAARAYLALLGTVALAACTPSRDLAQPAERAAAVERPERLSRSGDHAAAAQRWEQIAAGAHGDARVQALAAAAREWLRAASPGDARRVGAALEALPDVDPRSAAGTTRGIVVAEVALAAGQPEQALTALRALGEPPPAGAEAEILLLRGRACLDAGRARDGIAAFAARERVLPPAQLADNRRSLWDALRSAAARGADVSPPAGADPVTAGWLELARIVTRGQRNPFTQRAQLAAWRTRYPLHPASSAVVDAMQDTDASKLKLPGQIALLLPLSGRLTDAGESLRDGFMTAYYQQDVASRPIVRIYDSTTDAAASYLRALADGAAFVVGPLGKENVAAVRAVADGSVPTLVLNMLSDGETTPQVFYQFALAPEDEARQVAEQLLSDGRRMGVALVPGGEWGARVLTAFQGAFTGGGGTLVTTMTYGAGTTDFSAVLVPLLGFEESQHRHQALVAIVGGPLQFTPRRRDDLQFVFFAGQPVQGRLVRPQLKFHYAGDLPFYSTSDIYDPDPQANQDLEGATFVDIPWLIADEPAVAELRATVAQLWPANARRRGRLFAMGFDTWRLVGAFATASGPIREPLAGMTGRLTIDAAGRVRRKLDWATVGPDGEARPLPARSPDP